MYAPFSNSLKCTRGANKRQTLVAGKVEESIKNTKHVENNNGIIQSQEQFIKSY